MDSSPENRFVEEDVELLASSSVPISLLDGTTVLITGATGLIGSLVVKTLMRRNRAGAANIKVLALTRSLEKANTVFGSLATDPLLELLVGDVVSLPPIKQPVDYVIHGASVTNSKDFVTKPVETIVTSILGTLSVLNLALDKNARSLVYLSSMEVFGITNPALDSIREQDYGYIDILDPRSSYPESKRLAESLCASFYKEYGLPAKIARLSQTVGPGMDPSDGRVAAYFARCAAKGEDIVLRTEGRMIRSSLYTRDAVDAIFRILLTGTSGDAYSVANKSTAVPIREIAEMVASRIAGGRIKVLYRIDVPPEYAINQDLKLVLNTDKLERLGWKPEVGLEESYRRLIGAMESDLANGAG